MRRLSNFLLLALSLSLTSFGQDKNSTVAGIVTDERSREVIQGAAVSVVGNQTNPTATDNDGLFVMTVPRGVDSFRIRVEKSGYRIYEKLVPVPTSIPLRIALVPMGPDKKTAPPPPKPADPTGPGPSESQTFQDSVAVVHTPASVNTGAKTLGFTTTGAGEYENKLLDIAAEQLEFDPPGIVVSRDKTPVTLKIDRRKTVTIVRFTDKGFVINDHRWPGIQLRVALIKAEPVAPASDPPKVEVNAPNGIAITGGNVTNPTVNNFGPPPPPTPDHNRLRF